VRAANLEMLILPIIGIFKRRRTKRTITYPLDITPIPENTS
jgi:hypothetical protein